MKRLLSLETKARLQQLFSELTSIPYSADMWGSGEADRRIFGLGMDMAEAVEWLSGTMPELTGLISEYAGGFRKTGRGEIFRALRAADGYLSEYGDQSFIDPLIKLMKTAYHHKDRHMAGRCALLLEKTGRGPKVLKYVQWALSAGLIQSW